MVRAFAAPFASLPVHDRPVLRRYRIMALLTVISSVFFLSSASAQTIVNPSFESPALAAGTFTQQPTGTSWTFTGGAGLSTNGSGFTNANPNAPQGTQVSLFQGTGSISQTLSSLSIGTSYTVTFSAANRAGYGPQTWDFRVDGTTVKSFDPGAAATAYTDYTATFTATATSHAIGFFSTAVHGGDVTVFIDNVRITAPAGVPSTPSSLTATATGNTQINLTWVDNSSNETSFKIERKTGSGGTYAQIATPAANATSYSNTGLAASTQYYYRIRSHNASGDSSYSAEANETTTAGPPPNVPSGLTATVISTSQINLAWTDNSNNENLFKIQRKTGSGGTYGQVGYVGTNVSSYSDTALTAATTYYYRVVSNNTNGDSAPSNETNATTQAGVPTAPSGLSAAEVSNVQINLAWTDGSNNETGFKIERKTGSGGTYALVTTTAANVTTYQNTGLVASTQYYYRVKATNAAGDSAYTAEANATTAAGPPPNAPSGLVATAISASQITLAWTDNSSNENLFKIQRKTGSGGTYSQVGYVGTNVTSCSDTALTAGTTYYYRVVSNNTNGDSAPSNEANATTQTGVPTAPSGLSAAEVSNVQINLAWIDASSNETGFKIERKTGSGGTYALVTTTAANVTAYQNTGLAASTQYYYRVKATNAAGDSAYTAEANATTAAGPPPNAPSGLGATVISTSQINLAWTDNSSNENLFKIQRKTGSGGTYSQVGYVGTNVNSYSDTALTVGTTYYYRVVSNNTNGDSAPSNEVNATTQSGQVLPAAPSAVAATATSSSQINLSWIDNASNETSFKIERKTGAGGTYAQVGTTGTNVNTYQNTGLTAGTEYFYRVRSSNGAGDSSYSDQANTTTEITSFSNPGVYSQTVNGMLYEWIPTQDVNFQIQGDGKVKIIAPLTKPSSNGVGTCKRFIYDHTHTRLSAADSTALFGSGLLLPPGNYGFAILWINANTYDEVRADPWNLTSNPDTYQYNSTKTDYFNLSIVPVSPGTPAASAVREVLIPYDLQRVSWLPHYQVLPYNLSLPADRGFGVTRLLMDIPLAQVYQKVTQIQYEYSFLDFVPNALKWRVKQAYPGESNATLISNAICDPEFGYMSQMDECFGAMGDPNHFERAQQVLQGIYGRLVNEKGVTSPNQTRMYDDYFTALEGYDNGVDFKTNFNATTAAAGLSSQAAARKLSDGVTDCRYFTSGAYSFRNWMQGGYLDSFAHIPEGIRIYNEIYNFEKRFMAAPDRKVAKMGWTDAEGGNSTMYRAGTTSRLHFPAGDVIRTSVVAWPFHMMLNEAFWTVLLGNDYDLWHSNIQLVSDILYFTDSGSAGAGPTLWQPTGGSIVNYDSNNPTHPTRSTTPLGRFPEDPHLGESGAFTGSWLVSQLTTASDRISQTIEYCPFSYKINSGSVLQGYYNSTNPTFGVLGNAKLSRYGVANYNQSNIVKTYEAKKPICLYTQGTAGGALIYHNVYCGLADVNDVTVTTPYGTKTFQVKGNNLHVFYVN